MAKYSFFNGTKSEYTYYTQNAHGDVVNLTDAEGNVTKTYTYDAFGVEKNIDASDTNAFRYCGEYYDAETGTIYLRARYYSPSIGRFISRDSFAGIKSDPLSLNLYTYCANNPIVYVDPSGYSYALLPDGSTMTINSPGDVEVLNRKRAEHQKAEKQKRLDARIADIPEATCKEYYDSIDEAAIDFVLQYGQASIETWCEYDAVINAVDVNGVTMYKLGECGIGEPRMDEDGDPTYGGRGAELYFESNTVAYVHTHGQYVGWKNNCFSIGPDSDISIAYNHNVIAYVGVPNGNVLVFDPAYDVVYDQANTGRVIFNRAPIDPNDPEWKVD